MQPKIVAFSLSFLALFWLFPGHAAGDSFTRLQTQSIAATDTNWGSGTGGITDPPTFQEFDPSLGSLISIHMTLTIVVHNEFMLVFYPTPTPTTLYVATTQTSDPSILADPNKVKLLTDGPTVPVFGPNGSSTEIFGGPGVTLPVDVVSRTESSGTWSSMLPVTDPHYIPPSNATLSVSRVLDDSNAPSLFSQFIGTGTVGLPITATASSSFYSDSGNGGGMVLTTAGAILTLQYEYAAAIPEPSGLILLGLGISLGFFALGLHRRAASPALPDRP